MNKNGSKLLQKGYTLVEVGIVILLLTLITAAKLREQSQELRTSIAKAQGQQLKILNEGLYNYGFQNYSAIINNTPVTGVAVTRAPTVAELVAKGNLNSGFSANGYYGAGYVTSITPAPVGCVNPNCNIAGLVYLNQPIRDPFTGNVDGPSIGEAVLQIGSDGGSSLRVANTIQGTGGGWSVANPLGATQGILAARSGLGSQLDMTGYFKRDGSLPMAGDIDMGNNSIINIQTVVEGAACASVGDLSRDASGAVLTCQGGVQKRQGSNYWQDAVNNFASLPACNAANLGQTRVALNPTAGTGPRAYTCSAGTWQALAVNDTGNLVLSGTATTGKLALLDVVTSNTACTPNGLVARNSLGDILSCKSGFWQQASAAAPLMGDTATMVLPAGSNYNVSVSGAYFTYVDVCIALRLNGVNQKTHCGSGYDSEGDDQNSIFDTYINLPPGTYTFSFTGGSQWQFNWIAYKS